MGCFFPTTAPRGSPCNWAWFLEAWQSRKRAGSKGNRMWDQVHIVIAIPARYAVFAGDNISGCGYWVSTAGEDEAVIRNWIRRQAKRTSAWTKSTLGYPCRKGPRRDAAGRLNERGNCSRTEFVPYQGRKRASAHCRSAVIGFEIGSSRGCTSTGPSSGRRRRAAESCQVLSGRYAKPTVCRRSRRLGRGARYYHKRIR